MTRSVARLSITVDIPNWTVAELKKVVDEWDFDPYRDHPIDVKDILTMLFAGDLQEAHIIMDEKMEDRTP